MAATLKATETVTIGSDVAERSEAARYCLTHWQRPTHWFTAAERQWLGEADRLEGLSEASGARQWFGIDSSSDHYRADGLPIGSPSAVSVSGETVTVTERGQARDDAAVEYGQDPTEWQAVDGQRHYLSRTEYREAREATGGDSIPELLTRLGRCPTAATAVVRTVELNRKGSSTRGYGAPTIGAAPMTAAQQRARHRDIEAAKAANPHATEQQLEAVATAVAEARQARAAKGKRLTAGERNETTERALAAMATSGGNGMGRTDDK